MRYRFHVLAKHPTAKPVILRRYPDTEPRYVAIFVGDKCLDIHEPDGDNGSWGGARQLHNAAWRSAHYWLVRNKSAVV